ncbi:MAG: hypothetical protein IJW39_01480 [Opitutales bacterium]|nr:hypothetical protein [Opitutales bacterium]
MRLSKEFIRKQLLKEIRPTGQTGIAPKYAVSFITLEFQGVKSESVLEDIEYLAGKGLLEFFASPISAGDKRVRITSAGIDFLEANPD